MAPYPVINPSGSVDVKPALVRREMCLIGGAERAACGGGRNTGEHAGAPEPGRNAAGPAPNARPRPTPGPGAGWPPAARQGLARARFAVIGQDL